MCPMQYFVFSIYAKPLDHILISDFVLANLFMRSLPGMILLYLATPFLCRRSFCMRYIYIYTYLNILLFDNCVTSSITYHTLCMELKLMVNLQIGKLQQPIIKSMGAQQGKWTFLVHIRLVYVQYIRSNINASALCVT